MAVVTAGAGVAVGARRAARPRPERRRGGGAHRPRPRPRRPRPPRLQLPGTGFVARASVSGSDDRTTFTTVGSSRVFDLAGANGRVRSMSVTFAPSDFRYLQLRVTGVPRIEDANNPSGSWYPVADGTVYRVYGKTSPPLQLTVQARYLRVRIVNSDDPPLSGVRVKAFARPRTILVEGGHDEPLRLWYGGGRHTAPDYEFARLPFGAHHLAHARLGTLGAAEANAGYRAAPATGSWVKRHPVVLAVVLALAAAAVVLAGFLALRRST